MPHFDTGHRGAGGRRATFPKVLKAANQLASFLEHNGGEHKESQEVLYPIKLTTLDVTGTHVFAAL